MKYKDCLDCNQLGTNCDGPDLLLLNAIELGEWLNELRMRRPGMTYDKTAAETGVSKTAVYNFLTGAHADCRLETVRPIAKLLIGGDCDDNPCGNVTNSEKAAYEEKIRQLEEGITWRDDKIKHLTGNYESMTTLITNTNRRNAEQVQFLQEQIRNRNRTVGFMSLPLTICVLLIMVALVVDSQNGDIGFFWLSGALQGEAVFVFVSIVVLVCLAYGIIWFIRKRKQRGNNAPTKME